MCILSMGKKDLPTGAKSKENLQAYIWYTKAYCDPKCGQIVENGKNTLRAVSKVTIIMFT